MVTSSFFSRNHAKNHFPYAALQSKSGSDGSVIGVFDSGFGGLTVHRALIDALPTRDFVYLNDNQNAPYGTRPPIEVLNLTYTTLDHLFAEGCTLAIVACNTASVVALR